MMTTVRVKICGITNKEDALKAVDFGADALGFIFHRSSPRYIDPQRAREIIKTLPPFVNKVGLFVNEEADNIKKTIDISGVDSLQFHGEEEEFFCSSFNRPWIKTIKVTVTTNLQKEIGRFLGASALLFDTGDDLLAGGTGKSFEWSLIPDSLDKPIIVAGGLMPSNVQQVVDVVSPFAVDVCSGVEHKKGKKNINKMKEFISRAKKRELHV